MQKNPYLLLFIAFCLSGCQTRERQVSVADLQGLMALTESAAGAGLSVYFSLDAPQGTPGSINSGFDTSDCPVLRDDVQVTVNGGAVSLDNRGGYYVYGPMGPLGKISNECHEIEGHLDFDPLPPAVEVVFSDGTGTISSQVQALFDPPAIALAPGQAQAVKPGDTVRLAFTPATSRIRAGDPWPNPLWLGTAAQPEAHSVPFIQDGGNLQVTMSMSAPGAAQLVLDRPLLDAQVTSCVGAVSCAAHCEWPTYVTPAVPITVAPIASD